VRVRRLRLLLDSLLVLVNNYNCALVLLTRALRTALINLPLTILKGLPRKTRGKHLSSKNSAVTQSRSRELTSLIINKVKGVVFHIVGWLYT